MIFENSAGRLTHFTSNSTAFSFGLPIALSIEREAMEKPRHGSEMAAREPAA
jgi:hypothetical protein